MTSASARQPTPYGEASISWRLEDGSLWVEARVPVGAEAVLDLDGLEEEALGSGSHSRTVARSA